MKVEFRPKDLDEVYGQEHLIVQVQTWLMHKNIPQSLLISGPYGCGKTTLARIIADNLTQSTADVHEINAAESRGIDDVRSWAESARFSPIGSARIYIIDELHQMTEAAQSALLKVVEEPSPGIYFIFCTTEPSKLKLALISRCHRLEVKLLNRQAVKKLAIKLGHNLNDEEIDYLYSASQGHARDIVKMLSGSGPNGERPIDYKSVAEVDKWIKYLCDNPGYFATNQKQITEFLLNADESALTQSLDSNIDKAMLNVPVLRSNYINILELRHKRKLYLSNARENILYFLSLL